MVGDIDPALVAFCGSENRVRTLGVLANAEFPMSGYRVAKVAGVPESKAYPELLRAVRAGLVQKSREGYRLTDPGVRALLRVRVRLYWAEDWDRSRSAWPAETPRLLKEGLKAIRERIRRDPSYLRPRGWSPPAAASSLARELRRDPAKDDALRRRARRTSLREDWVR